MTTQTPTFICISTIWIISDMLVNPVFYCILSSELGKPNFAANTFCSVTTRSNSDAHQTLRARFFIHNSGIRIVGTECIRNILFIRPWEQNGWNGVLSIPEYE